MPAERRATRLTVPVERLREVIAERRRTESMRVIAAEVGIGTTTLWQIVRGATPQPRTHAKLADWYLRIRAAQAESDAAPTTDATLAALAIGVLTRHASPDARPALARGLLRVLESTPDVPEWLGEIRPPDR